MKNVLMILAMSLAFSVFASADDRPVKLSRLPESARTFISEMCPGDNVTYATVDDDLIRPDYNVVLASGTHIQFENDGRLEKIESRAGVPDKVVPVQVRDYVRSHYPDALIIEYEVGKRTYEVKLSNRLDLKFNKYFNLIEVDD